MAVCVSPVADIIDDHLPGVLVDSVYDPIVANPNTIQLLRRTQLARAARNGVLLQCLNLLENT
jgi:hypothetical protein